LSVESGWFDQVPAGFEDYLRTVFVDVAVQLVL
jgi:hypothetical protein